jgi:Ca-activated chloride channel family protein
MVAVKYGFMFIAFILIITALARPWGKPIKSEVQLSGIDIMVAVDVSSSMAAGDLKPSRMEVIKQGLKDFTASLAGDRIGMMTFAGTNFVQCPLTTDYDAYDLIIDSLYPGMLFKDGTALGDAIKASVERMVEKGEKSKIMILITDGESNMGTVPIDAAKIAKDKDIRIYTIGVGTQEGGRIPEGTDMFGRVYFKTYEGAEVITKLDDRELKEIAGVTGGKYYRVTELNAFKSIKDDIRYMEENKTKKDEIKHEENYTMWLLWGILFFVASQVMNVRKISDFKLPFNR